MDISRRVAAARAAGFHQRPSDPSRRATTAWPNPTARAPTGRNRNAPPSLPSLPCAARAGAWHTKAARISALQRSRLIDEHDGDIIAERIAEPAVLAIELRLLRMILELALALGADQN